MADDPLTTADGWFRPHQPNCLGCGDENPLGLRLRMRPRGEGVTGQVAFDEYGDSKTRVLTVYEVQSGAWKPVKTDEFK